MRTRGSPVAHWLSLRVRIACTGIFCLSLFLPPYIPDVSTAAPDLPYEDIQYLLVEEGFLMKTSSLTEQGTRLAYAEGIIHVVEANESVASIAQFYGLQTDTIRWANKLDDGDAIQPGQELVILPVDGILHRVQRGQTLSRIAELYDIPAEQIRTQNSIDNYILAGQELIIPGGKPIIETVPPVVVATEPTPSQPNQQPTVPPRQLEEKPPSIRRQIYEEPSPGIMQKPCDCYYTQYFSSRHFAVDMQHKGGGVILASEAGTVIRAEYGWNGGYGNVIEVDHGNGLVTLYAHNKELHVEVGDTVQRGEHIADMGNSGLVYGPTGIHVHFEVRVNGIKKNPLLYLQ